MTRSRSVLVVASLCVTGAVLPLPGALAQGSDPENGQFTIEEATAGMAGSGDDPLVAAIHTSKGTIKCELYAKLAPNTVANFVGLARGKRAWLDAKTNTWVKKPFYNGLTFHRAIPKFLIQGGDQANNGTGNPGYQFNDEIVDKLKFDKPGRLAMANAGKKPDGSGTNGSQFFIAEEQPTYLNGLNPIFGTCDLPVVKDIARVPVDTNDKPLTPVTIKKIIITRKTAASP